MLRSILVALDDTPGATAACHVAIALARETGAALTAAVLLHRPPAKGAPVQEPPAGGVAEFRPSEDAEAAARATLAACAAAAGDLPFTELRLDEEPQPALVGAVATHDLVVIGRDSTLGHRLNEAGLPPAISTLLHHGARPLLVVPPGAAERLAAAADGPVLAAYDGSAPSRAAFHLFALLGLAGTRPVQVAAVSAQEETALAMAEEGAALLRQHGVDATALALVNGHPAAVLLEALESLGARLLVIGAFGGNRLLRMLVGSTTDRLLRQAPVPVFVHR